MESTIDQLQRRNAELEEELTILKKKYQKLVDKQEQGTSNKSWSKKKLTESLHLFCLF